MSRNQEPSVTRSSALLSLTLALIVSASAAACGQSAADTQGTSINEQIAGPRPTAMSTDAQTYIGGAWIDVVSLDRCSSAFDGYTDIEHVDKYARCLLLRAANVADCPAGFAVTAQFSDAYGSVVARNTSRILGLKQGEVRMVAVPTTHDEVAKAEVTSASCI